MAIETFTADDFNTDVPNLDDILPRDIPEDAPTIDDLLPQDENPTTPNIDDLLSENNEDNIPNLDEFLPESGTPDSPNFPDFSAFTPEDAPPNILPPVKDINNLVPAGNIQLDVNALVLSPFHLEMYSTRRKIRLDFLTWI